MNGSWILGVVALIMQTLFMQPRTVRGEFVVTHLCTLRILPKPWIYSPKGTRREDSSWVLWYWYVIGILLKEFKLGGQGAGTSPMTQRPEENRVGATAVNKQSLLSPSVVWPSWCCQTPCQDWPLPLERWSSTTVSPMDTTKPQWLRRLQPVLLLTLALNFCASEVGHVHEIQNQTFR